jgi:mono/diheme cytochrome c family protein
MAACGEANEKQNAIKTDTGLKENVDSSELVETGQSLFLQQCATCHAINMNLTGPALKGVEKRWKSKEKLAAFIRNSQAVIASNDAYAKDLYEHWHKVLMPPFPSINDEEITAILAYIKHAENN